MASTHKRYQRSLAVLAIVGAFALAACGSSGGGGKAQLGSKEFPTSQFPKSAFGGLSGSAVLYDTSGGSVTQGRNATINKRFTQATGVKFSSDFNNGTAKFFAAAQAGQVSWSVVELNSKAQLLEATKKGYLAKIDPSVVPVDKLEDGTYTDYGIPEQLYGTVLVYNTKKWPDSGKHPETLEDLFDTKDFPGPRCLPKDPNIGAPGVFEGALLASGVPKDQLYPFDLDRAFKELDTIKSDTVWWLDGDSAIRNLTTGECDMGLAWSARAYAAISGGASLKAVWKNTVISNAYYAVPKDAPNLKAGMAFLAMQLDDTKGQVELVNRVPYPMPIKSIPVSAYSEKVQPFLPVGKNYSEAIQLNGDYYAEHLPELEKAFSDWLVK